MNLQFPSRFGMTSARNVKKNQSETSSNREFAFAYNNQAESCSVVRFFTSISCRCNSDFMMRSISLNLFLIPRALDRTGIHFGHLSLRMTGKQQAEKLFNPI